MKIRFLMARFCADGHTGVTAQFLYRTYPSTLLWETFTAPAAVSSSTGATVLLSTLSDTKTDTVVRAGRAEVSVKRHINTDLQHYAASTWFVQTQICTGCICLCCGACWDTVGGKLLYTVRVCDQLCFCILWSVIHLFMQHAVVHECGKLWNLCTLLWSAE